MSYYGLLKKHAIVELHNKPGKFEKITRRNLRVIKIKQDHLQSDLYTIKTCIDCLYVD